MLKFMKRLFDHQNRSIVAHVPIAGIRYYRAAELSELMHKGDELSLEHEISNPHDPNAVMIFWHRNKIGYVPSAHARQISEMIDEHREVCGKIVAIDPEAGESHWVTLNIYLKTF